MRVLLVHDYYRQRGGEDEAFEAEAGLLRDRGIDVAVLTTHNCEIDDSDRVQNAIHTTWNRAAAGRVVEAAVRHDADVVHFHNTFPRSSPLVYRAVRARGLRVVQTLHNFRLLCANGLLFRDGHVCLDCVGRAIPWSALAHRCYRGSLPATGAVTMMQMTHRLLRTWRRIDRLIAVSEFTREQYVNAGLDPQQIVVKPNFLRQDPGEGTGDADYVLFVGRVVPEKGWRTVLRAWRENPELPLLRIVGDGPDLTELQQAAAGVPSVEVLGRRSRGEVLDLLGRARMLLSASEWYETSGLVGIEAFSRGTPVVAPAFGALKELLSSDDAGRLFATGDSAALARAVLSVKNLAPDAYRAMRRAARDEFVRKYTPEASFQRAMAIYEDAHTS